MQENTIDFKRCLACEKLYVAERSDSQIKDKFCSAKCERNYRTPQREVDELVKKIQQGHFGTVIKTL